MLPYPSGEPHIGHLKTYSVGDAVAHFRRRNGYRVLHPMGYDAFGLPAENHAIRTGPAPARVHPGLDRRRSAASSASGGSRSTGRARWPRTSPSYYRWTQWLFLRLFERDLAYRKEAAVNWCPKDATVLANEQVIDGRCERCGTLVESRDLEQWFFAITKYADRLLDDMRDIDWPPNVVAMQENWIGRSEGARVTFHCDANGADYEVFTTRPDTLFGATFFVMAPEHPDVLELNDSRRGARVREPRAHRVRRGARRRGPREDRRAARHHRHQPGQRRADPDVRGRLRADGVRHRRDHGRARPRRARLRVRAEVRPADHARGRVRRAAVRRRRPAGELRPLRRHAQPRGVRRDRGVAGLGGQGRAGDQLPPARLAALAPALLGLPDPDRALRLLRPRARARRPAAGRAARRRGLRAQGPLAAGRRRGLGEHHLPAVRRRRRCARPTRWTPSSTRPGTSCATATPATTRRRGTARCCATGCRWTSTSAAWSTRSCT